MKGGGPKEGIDYNINMTFKDETVNTLMGAEGNAFTNAHRGVDTIVTKEKSYYNILSDANTYNR